LEKDYRCACVGSLAAGVVVGFAAAFRWRMRLRIIGANSLPGYRPAARSYAARALSALPVSSYAVPRRKPAYFAVFVPPEFLRNVSSGTMALAKSLTWVSALPRRKYTTLSSALGSSWM